MSQTFNLADVKYIHQFFKDTVHGYLRQTQPLLKDSLYYNIPTIIEHTILLYYSQRLNSSILTDSETITFFDLLDKHKKNLGYHWNLIYHGKKNGLDENIFKNKCHDKQNIVCIIHTKNNNVFGGYTYKGWSGQSRNSIMQSDDKAFIFAIRSSKPNKYGCMLVNVHPEQTKCALQIYSGYYCIFGWNATIYIDKNNKAFFANNTNYPHTKFNDCSIVVDLEVFQVS
eukprot:204751_1